MEFHHIGIFVKSLEFGTLEISKFINIASKSEMFEDEIIGVIDDYNGESELLPLAGNSITLLGQGATIVPTVIQLSDLNDASRNNKLETGEQWEGVYVELHNVTVATVDPFSGGSRVSFNV